MNSFGQKFRITLFGESHGEGLGVVIDGIPAGIPLSESDFEADLARRRSSGKPGTTPRKEADQPQILSGIFEGKTTGAPLSVTFRNENTRSTDYRNLIDHPRPSHSDWVAAMKYNHCNDYRGGGHFSGRVTLGMVVAGTVAKKILPDVSFQTTLIEIGGEKNPECFETVIEEAVRACDSVGGIVECRAKGLPAGVGEPFFDSVESVASHLIFSVPAVKGVEFGSGFTAARMRGSEHNDPIINARGTTATNHAGGINGGISNGNEIVLRAAVKPTASIAREQQTFNFSSGQIEPLVIKGRHDACIALRAAVVIEAALAIALADLYLIGK